MSKTADARKIQDFLKDLGPVCQKHNAKIFGGVGVVLQVDDAVAFSEVGLDFGEKEISLEVGPVWDCEEVLYTHEGTSKSTENVFNPAGVDNPLPPERE